MSARDSVDVKASIDSEGVYWVGDLNVGDSVVQFLKDGLPFDSATGLKLVQQNILEQQVCCPCSLESENYLLTQ
jgi:hypothetical protein